MITGYLMARGREHAALGKHPPSAERREFVQPSAGWGAKGCTTVTVLAAEAAIPPLTELGFVPDGHYVTHGGGQCEAPTLDEVELFEPHHSLGVLRLDKLASGEDRRVLLSEHFYASRIFVNKGKVQGNYMVLLGEGLVVAENAYAGEELLRLHLPHVSEITLPEANSAAIQFLEQRKYREQRRVLRMRRGPALHWRPVMLWGRIGNNLGQRVSAGWGRQPPGSQLRPSGPGLTVVVRAGAKPPSPDLLPSIRLSAPIPEAMYLTYSSWPSSSARKTH